MTTLPRVRSVVSHAQLDVAISAFNQTVSQPEFAFMITRAEQATGEGRHRDASDNSREQPSGDVVHSGSKEARYLRLSCIILSYNSSRYLGACVRSLAQWIYAQHSDDEILVVENGSTDGSVDILRDLESAFPGLVHGIYLKENTGTTRSRNMAAAQARGRFLAFVDSDVVATSDVLGSLIEHLTVDSRCGIACPRLVYPTGRFQLSFDVFPTLQRKVARFFTLKRIERRLAKTLDLRRPMKVDYSVSAFWVMRRSTFDAVGGFDERIFYAPEDVDFCIRLWAAGYYVLYDPRLVVIHHAQEISRGLPLKRSTYRHLRGLIYLFRKHHYVFSAPHHPQVHTGSTR